MERIGKVCLVSSSGGHFMYLYVLRDFWSKYERCWVTFHSPVDNLLQQEKVYWAFSPTNRNVINLIRNFFLALSVLFKEKPSLLVTTGAGISVPFVYVARFLGVKSVYIESLNRVTNLSLSGRLVYFFVDYFLVRWPGLTKKYKKTMYEGRGI